MKPRPYQVDAVQSIYKYFEGNSGNPILVMPTGTGKSVVIGMFAAEVICKWPGQRIMVVTHVKELVRQNHNKLKQLWSHAPCGIYSAGLKQRDTMHPILFAGIGSVYKRPAEFGCVNLLIIDEAHLVSPNDETKYQQFIKALKEVNPHLKVIGLTATPWRMGVGHITSDGIFTDVCYDIAKMEEFNKLLEEGYLSPLIPKHPKTILDVSGVHLRGGDFIESELQAAVNKDSVTEAALAEFVEYGKDRHKWLVFASGVDHAIAICDMLNDKYGVPTTVIHGKLSDAERDQRLADYHAGKYICAVNNNILTTGFDAPTIDYIGILRPTMSTNLWVQILGRGTRPVYADGFDLDTTEGRLAAIAAGQKQNCLVMDFAGNTMRLGPINDPVIPRKKGEKGGEAPVKLCGTCGTYNHASLRFCCACNAEFTFTTKLKVEAATGDIVKREEPPQVTAFQVDTVVYNMHHKDGKPPMIKVDYYCGIRKFTEYVCPQHEGYALRKAREWWRLRSPVQMPETTSECLALTNSLTVPAELDVWVNLKYPQIMNIRFHEK